MPEETVNGAPGLLADADPVPAAEAGASGTEGQPAPETGEKVARAEGKPEGGEKADAASEKTAPEKTAPEKADPEKSGPEKSGPEDAEDKALAEAWKAFAANPQEGVDAEIFSSFADSAKQMGLKPEQARALVEWQMKAIKKQADKMREEGMASLKQEWGNATKGNLGHALELVTAIDRKCDGAFSKSLGKFGIANDADFIKGLHFMASMLGEDSLAALHNGGGTPQREETPYEGIVNALKELKK